MGKSQKYFKQQQDYLGHVNGHVEEMYGSHLVMKAFNGKKKSVAKFDEYNKKWYGGSWKTQFFSGLTIPLMSMIGNLGYVGVAILGGYLAFQNIITVGDIQELYSVCSIFYPTFITNRQYLECFTRDSDLIRESFRFSRRTRGIPDTTTSLKLDNVQGNVEFQHVKFGYTPEKIIIKDFSAAASPGQKIAIVGPTGAGKTTLVKLLMRFYELNDGVILIDGHNSLEFTRNDLRNIFGMVLQDSWLYNTTIMENIRYGCIDATDEGVITAAKIAYVDNFVRKLPDGYNMMMNEGSQ